MVTTRLPPPNPPSPSAMPEGSGLHRGRRMTGIGPGNVIEKWLNAYGEGDVNRLEDLEKWRNGDYGWVQSAPSP